MSKFLGRLWRGYLFVVLWIIVPFGVFAWSFLDPFGIGWWSPPIGVFLGIQAFFMLRFDARERGWLKR